MRAIILVCLILFICPWSISAQEINYSEKELIIKIKSDVEFDCKNCLLTHKFKNNKIDSLNKAASVESIKATGNRTEGRAFLLKLKYKSNIKQLVEDYMDTGLFEFVEPNYIGKSPELRFTPNDEPNYIGNTLGLRFTPNDELYYNRQWTHYNDGTFPLSNATDDADMDTDLAWDITQGSANITVAILDSGLKLDHPEFAGRMWINDDEVLDGTDTDNNGYIDDLNWGWDFVNDDNEPQDDCYHGTLVTGIGFATGNNRIGYAGVDWNCKIMVCKVTKENCYGNYVWWSDAIYYAVDNGANVIKMVGRGESPSTLLENAVNYAYDNNVYVVVGAGSQNSLITQYPAKYDNVLTIGATDPDDTRSVGFDPGGSSSGGSNFGPELDFVAPGNFIYFVTDLQLNINYEEHAGGTSATSPLVAGVISLLLSINPNLTSNEIRTILEESSEDQVGDFEDTPGWDQYYGHGRINAYNAVTHLLVGLDQITDIENNIIVYPNPTDGILTIRSKTTIAQIEIYNQLGQLVFSIANENEIDISTISQGLYFIKVKDENGNFGTKKVVKK